MREAVVHIDAGSTPVPAGSLERGRAVLAEHGARIHRHVDGQTVELVVPAPDADAARRDAIAAWERVYGTAPSITAVTFISRGTDEDALGVVQAFGLTATLQRTEADGEEVMVITLAAADRRRVPEAQLHTALEAALNCEIRLAFA